MTWNQAVIRGITAILPDDILSIFSPQEMKEVVCGGEHITVESLQAIVEYGEGVDASASVIQRFWRVVTGFTYTQRSRLLEFVCARTRIPVLPPLPYPSRLFSFEAETRPYRKARPAFQFSNFRPTATMRL